MKLAKQFHDFMQARRAQQRGVGVMQMPHLAAFAGLGPYSQASAASGHHKALQSLAWSGLTCPVLSWASINRTGAELISEAVKAHQHAGRASLRRQDDVPAMVHQH